MLALCIKSGKRQSKTPLNRQRGSKVARNSVFDFHLSLIGRQKASENLFQTIFDILSSMVLTFSIAGYQVCVCWVILHAFLSSADFLKKLFREK